MTAASAEELPPQRITMRLLLTLEGIMSDFIVRRFEGFAVYQRFMVIRKDYPLTTVSHH
jgi:hypothetical protein